VLSLLGAEFKAWATRLTGFTTHRASHGKPLGVTQFFHTCHSLHTGILSATGKVSTNNQGAHSSPFSLRPLTQRFHCPFSATLWASPKLRRNLGISPPFISQFLNCVHYFSHTGFFKTHFGTANNVDSLRAHFNFLQLPVFYTHLLNSFGGQSSIPLGVWTAIYSTTVWGNRKGSATFLQENFRRRRFFFNTLFYAHTRKTTRQRGLHNDSIPVSSNGGCRSLSSSPKKGFCGSPTYTVWCDQTGILGHQGATHIFL